MTTTPEAPPAAPATGVEAAIPQLVGRREVCETAARTCEALYTSTT